MASKMSVFTRVKILFGSIGTMIGGGIIIYGPDVMSEQIPFHQPLGYGFVALGVLMFLALFFVRAKALIATLLIAGLAAGAIWGAFSGAFPAWQAILMGILGIGGAFGAVGYFIAFLKGEDPT